MDCVIAIYVIAHIAVAAIFNPVHDSKTYSAMDVVHTTSTLCEYILSGGSWDTLIYFDKYARLLSSADVF